MIFIDSDIGFHVNDVFALLALQLADPENVDIITGPYPKKSISWEKIAKAVKMGHADENPFALENFVGDYVFNPAKGVTEFRVDQPVEVLEAGTGFMCIPRSTFEKYEEAYPEYKYLPDHIRTDAFDGSREIMAYFDCIIDPESKRYLSEDYMFCQNVRKAGMKVWMCRGWNSSIWVRISLVVVLVRWLRFKHRQLQVTNQTKNIIRKATKLD